MMPRNNGILDDCFGAAAASRARIKHVVYCPACKTAIHVEPNTTSITCPNPACQKRIAIDNPTFQRGSA